MSKKFERIKIVAFAEPSVKKAFNDLKKGKSEDKRLADFLTLCLVTCKDTKEARKIAKSLLKKKLVACANIIPKIESHYRWNGKIEKGSEALLILKTKRQLQSKVSAEIKKLHSYKLPVIEFVSSKTGKEVEKWVGKETI